MQEFLFNPSLWMPAAAFAVAVGVFLYGNARVKRSVRNAGAGLFALTIVWCVAAYFVQTRVEQCVARTRSIVAAVEKADWATLRSLVDKTTRIDLPSPLPPAAGPDAVVQVTQINAASYGLKSIRTYSTTAIEGPGTVDVTFTSLLEGLQPLTATFRFEYEQRSDGMLLSKIVLVQVGDKSMDELRNAIR